MYCSNCGNEISDNANFCSNCGNPKTPPVSENTSKKVTEDSKESNQNEYSKYWYNKGVEFSESHEYERALYAYNQALAIDGMDPDIWNNKCYVLTKLGRYEEAINAGNSGVNFGPNDPVIWNTLRDAYLANNNPEKAAECNNKISNLRTVSPPKTSTSNNYGKGIGICCGLTVLIIIIAVIYNNWSSIAKSTSNFLYGMVFLILLGGILYEGWKAVKH